MNIFLRNDEKGRNSFDEYDIELHELSPKEGKGIKPLIDGEKNKW